MSDSPYEIVFVKLAEAAEELASYPPQDELAEIDELRRFSMELNATEPASYTVA